MTSSSCKSSSASGNFSHPREIGSKKNKDAEKSRRTSQKLERQALLQKKEEDRRKELITQENEKKARLRAKKIALGLDPSIQRPPVLVDVPPPVVVAIKNASLDLRVNAKFVQKFQCFFNGHPIETEEFVSGGHHQCTLVIAKLTKRVTAEYYCTCENEEGAVSSTTCRWTTTSSLLFSSSHDGYVKVWDPVAMSNLLSVHIETYGIHSMLFDGGALCPGHAGVQRLSSSKSVNCSIARAGGISPSGNEQASSKHPEDLERQETRQLIAKYIKGSEA
ncbi:hypothetical protein Pcac1_g2867 [Phytophthora cactorum]|nr:hypothetical protein Pcac1_g2867 [Phytophthora cactorum]